MNTERAYYVAFSHFLGVGPHRFSLLLKKFKTAEAAYRATHTDLQTILGPVFLKKFEDFRQKYDPLEKMKEIENKGIQVVTCGENNYPLSLSKISDPPICLYIKGSYENFNFAEELFIGVVGTREPSSYGQQISRIFSEGLTHAGVNIVSGMALGVDTNAHTAALDAKGKTIAVLGCGVDIVYPPGNRGLYERIMREKGMIISEFPPGMMTLKGLFVARNRLISGLSAGIVVIEGKKKSGALITARYAAYQGKDVFAPPVPLTSPLSEAPNILLKQGAKLVTSVEDILEEYGLKGSNNNGKNILVGLSEDEKNIVESLIESPKRLDDLKDLLHNSLIETLNVLSGLEIKEVIEKNLEGKYQIRV